MKNNTHMALIMRILRQMITALLFCVKMRKKQKLLMIRKRKGLSVCANTSQLTSFLGSITRQRPDRTQRVEDITRYIGVYGF